MKAIRLWLTDNEAIPLCSFKPEHVPNVYTFYMVRGKTVIVVIYGPDGEDGWDAFISVCNQNNAVATIAALDAFINT